MKPAIETSLFASQAHIAAARRMARQPLKCLASLALEAIGLVGLLLPAARFATAQTVPTKPTMCCPLAA